MITFALIKGYDVVVDNMNPKEDEWIRTLCAFTAGPICKKKLYEDNIKGKFYIPFVLEDNCKCVEK